METDETPICFNSRIHHDHDQSYIQVPSSTGRSCFCWIVHLSHCLWFLSSNDDRNRTLTGSWIVTLVTSTHEIKSIHQRLSGASELQVVWDLDRHLATTIENLMEGI